jgi:putative N-acetylmannosamine-6-phosphate epimerase
MVPPNLGLSEAQADIAALDALRPRVQQLQQLVERAEDTETALGSDIIAVALEGYGLLKVSGKGEALKGARQALSARFAKSRRAAEPATVD